jgi:hypothetical protein
MFLVLIEDAHIAWDFDQYKLGDIDLHEDEQLMASSKDHSSEGEIDPLVSIHAEKVLVGVRLMLSVHNYKSSCHCGHRYHSKE